MEQKKTPLYILYYIDNVNKKLVKDSVIYDTEIINGADLASSTGGNTITIVTPKFTNAMSGELHTPFNRWVDIMDNQRSGAKNYYIVSSSSYNSEEYLEEPIYTTTFRPDEIGENNFNVTAYRPYFAGHLTKIECVSDIDTIKFIFSGFDWYYSKKLMDPDYSKQGSERDSSYYKYANLSYSYDPPGLQPIIAQPSVLMLPVFQTNNNPSDQHTDVIARFDNYNLIFKRSGLHHIKLSMNCQHTCDYPSTINATIYRNPCEAEADMVDSDGNPVNKIAIASGSITLEGGYTGTVQLVIDKIDDSMVDIPSIDLFYRRNGVLYGKMWTEVYAVPGSGVNGDVTYSYASFWASTSCYSLDHNSIYPPVAYTGGGFYWNMFTAMSSFCNSLPGQIMDSGQIKTLYAKDTANSKHFEDPIVDKGDEIKRFAAVNDMYDLPRYTYNKFTTSVTQALKGLIDQTDFSANWGSFLYSNGKICMDFMSADQIDIPIYTDYANTDMFYNIKDDYYNHFYYYFGSTSDKPDNHYHTVSHTLTEYLDGQGNVHKDPTMLMKATQYSGDSDKDEDMSDEDRWNTMGTEAQKDHEQYVRNKFWYVYRPDDKQIPDVRIGDYFVSTPESPLQIRRQITGISRVCEGGLIKWIYKMEGDE